ncbi:MAG: P-loop NTPase [Chloroflexi bacterium]|nr:P-loop NTPase [Chloroflexota bacterium]
MTFEQFCKILIKRWSLIAFCFLSVGLGAFIGSALTKPLYQSTALVEVIVHSGGDPLAIDNIRASQQLAATEAELATTSPILNQVASHYPGYSVDDIAREVTASVKTNTQLIQIDVLDPSSLQAANIANDIATTLTSQQLLVTQQSSTQGSFLVVAQLARPALSFSRPNKLINTGAGLLTGLLLGIWLALVFEHLDPRVRAPEELTQLLGWPVLGTLQRTAREAIAIHPTAYNPNIEAYDILHTHIQFAATDRPVRTLLVTSGMPGEGKSVVAANLAIRMAKAGKKVLVIDANLRHPTLYTQFNIPDHTKGFSNAMSAFSTPTTDNPPVHQQALSPATSSGSSSTSLISDLSSLDPFVQTVGTPNLSVIPSGPLLPNPPELLNSKAMPRFFTALHNYEADVVIFDTPSLLGLSDATILASKVDGTLIVADITRTTKGHLKQVKALLEEAGASVLGCVVNKAPHSREKASYSYNYGTRQQYR